jgi:hypothetical protein
MTRNQALTQADALLRALYCLRKTREYRQWTHDLNAVADALQDAAQPVATEQQPYPGSASGITLPEVVAGTDWTQW